MLQVIYEARRGDEVAYLYKYPALPRGITFVPDEIEDTPFSLELETMLIRFLKNFRAPAGLPKYITKSDAFVRSVDKSLGITFKDVYEYKEPEDKPGRVIY